LTFLKKYNYIHNKKVIYTFLLSELLLVDLHSFLINLKNHKMKKVLFAALMTIAVQGVFAQVNKGQWLVGGNVGFTSEKQGDDDDNKVSQFSFSPNAGYFFADKLAGGLRVNFSSRKVKSEEDAYSTLLIAPFVRYYFLPAAQKVNILADASYGFGSAGYDEKSSVSGFSISAGPAVFLSPNTALEFTLGYQSLKIEDVDDRKNSFGVNVGFQIHLGGGKK
jgi:hypothetical protein